MHAEYVANNLQAEYEAEVLAEMQANPAKIAEWVEDEGELNNISTLVADLLDNGLPLHNHSYADDSHVDRLERSIEIIRLLFTQWATRKPRWGGDSPLVAEIKSRKMED